MPALHSDNVALQAMEGAVTRDDICCTLAWHVTQHSGGPALISSVVHLPTAAALHARAGGFYKCNVNVCRASAVMETAVLPPFRVLEGLHRL